MQDNAQEALRRADTTVRCPRCGFWVEDRGIDLLSHVYHQCQVILDYSTREPWEVPDLEPLTES